MLHLVTGVPGAKKTAFVVSTLNDIEKSNKVNLVKNKAIFAHNQKIIDDNNLQSEFDYLDSEVGTGHELKRELTILDNDYFAMFTQDFDDLRPDDYFKRSVDYNNILERIISKNDKLQLKALLPVRTIYTNINNLKIDYVRANVYDWRTCPDGSIIVIDEVQLVEPYKETKQKDNSIVQDLTIHRHRGFDFYFITQSAALLHVQIKDLIAVHYHLTLPYGWVTKVYQYGSFRANPNAVSVKISAERSFSFNPPASIFKLYKSTTINTAQKRIPYKMMFGFGSIVLLGIFGFIWAFNSASNSALGKVVRGKDAPIASATAKTAIPASSPSATAATVASVSSATATMIAQNDAQIKILQQQQQIEQLQAQIKAQKTPSNVIAFANNCTAYNSDGLPLDMSLTECKQYATGKKQVLKVFDKQTNLNTLALGNVASLESVPNVASVPKT